MEPKFKIGDYVWITHTANRQLYKIAARNGGYYRLKANRWWEEDRLVLATPAQLAKMNGGSRAFWIFETPGYAKCSSCGRSFEALPTELMFKENNKLCRMCGKAMEVRDED